MIDPYFFTMKEVVMDDVIDQVKAEGATNQRQAERRAQQIWEDVCFPLDIYRTDQGSEGTQAEFMCDWLEGGYSWHSCIAHLKTLSLITGQKRAFSSTFKEDAMNRLIENVARTYAPQGA